MSNNFISFLEKAGYTEQLKEIPNIERFFNPNFFDDEIAGDIDLVLFIIDFRIQEFIYLSPNTDFVHGYLREEIQKLGPVGFYDLLHPKDKEILFKEVFRDISIFLGTNKTVDYTDLKINYNYRVSQKDGSYKFLMNRFTPISVGEGNAPLIIVGTVRDITDIYTKKEIFCKIHTVNNSKDIVFQKTYPINDSIKDFGITQKEFDVIKLVHQGKSSKEIASDLNNSLETIHTHRKNIIKKLNVNSMIDVIVLAKDNEWI